MTAISMPVSITFNRAYQLVCAHPYCTATIAIVDGHSGGADLRHCHPLQALHSQLLYRHPHALDLMHSPDDGGGGGGGGGGSRTGMLDRGDRIRLRRLLALRR